MSKSKSRRRASRAKDPNGPPKGSYRLPTGNYVASTPGPVNKQGRRLSITAVHKADPDADKVADAIIAAVLAQRHEEASQLCSSKEP